MIKILFIIIFIILFIVKKIKSSKQATHEDRFKRKYNHK